MLASRKSRMVMKIDPEERKKAEEFADYMEEEMRRIGATGDYFCTEQHKRWRQHTIRAFLGLSPGQDEDNTESATTSTKPGY